MDILSIIKSRGILNVSLLEWWVLIVWSHFDNTTIQNCYDDISKDGILVDISKYYSMLKQILTHTTSNMIVNLVMIMTVTVINNNCNDAQKW